MPCASCPSSQDFDPYNDFYQAPMMNFYQAPQPANFYPSLLNAPVYYLNPTTGQLTAENQMAQHQGPQAQRPQAQAQALQDTNLSDIVVTAFSTGKTDSSTDVYLTTNGSKLVLGSNPAQWLLFPLPEIPNAYNVRHLPDGLYLNANAQMVDEIPEEPVVLIFNENKVEIKLQGKFLSTTNPPQITDTKTSYILITPDMLVEENIKQITNLGQELTKCKLSQVECSKKLEEKNKCSIL